MIRRLLQFPRNSEIRVRVTVSAVLVSGLLTFLVFVAIVLLLYQEAVHSEQQELGATARQAATTVGRGDARSVIVTDDPSDLVQVVDTARHVLASTRRMAGRPPVNFPPPAPTDLDNRQDGRSCHIDAPGDDCFLVTVFRTTSPAGSHLTATRTSVFVYVLGESPGLVSQPLLILALGCGVPLVAGLVGYGNWRAAGRTLAPVEAIRARLDEITATDLQHRVPVPPRRDEIAKLAESVNATLDRLERAVAQQRGFVSDVSHELRSPLTGLRAELEVALADPESTDQRATLEAVLRSTERLEAVVSDLLALARLDSQQQMIMGEVDLAVLADQEVLRRQRRTVVTVVHPDPPVLVRGGALELARLLTNLIDNADRHAGSTVQIVIRDGPEDTAVVEVVDDGSGIAPADRERVFERFTRLAEGRWRDSGGTGLGLSISRDIAVAHGGTLTIEDRLDGGSGARFVVRLPKAGPQGPASSSPNQSSGNRT